MEINKLLLEGYLIFGIILTYTIAYIIGHLMGERYAEKENEKNEQQVQSKEKISIDGTKFTFLE